jgi:hypothetical protein
MAKEEGGDNGGAKCERGEEEEEEQEGKGQRTKRAFHLISAVGFTWK